MGKRGLGCTRRRREAAVKRLDEEEEWEVSEEGVLALGVWGLGRSHAQGRLQEKASKESQRQAEELALPF